MDLEKFGVGVRARPTRKTYFPLRQLPEKRTRGALTPLSVAAACSAACPPVLAGARRPAGQRIGRRPELVGERLTVLDMGDLLERDRRADRDRQRRTDPALHFVENQRQPQGEAQMAGDLEQPAVLAAEIDR